MSEREYHIYTDASFCKIQKKAVTGFLIFKSLCAHKENDISAAITEKTVIQEINNIRAELRGLILALEYFTRSFHDKMECLEKGDYRINVYTDCKNNSTLLARRTKLEENSFISKSSGKTLLNADLYKIIFSQFDLLNPQIIWVKGHSPNREKDFIQKNFNYLDKVVRKELRSIVKHKNW